MNNVGTVNVKNVAAGAGNGFTLNQALSTGLNKFNVTQAVATATTGVINGSAATVYGNSAGVADVMNIAFQGAATGRTLQLALAGAGLATAASTVNYAGAATDISTIKIDTLGSNNTNIGGTTSVRTVTVTGSGNNTVTLAANSVSATASVAISAADATGNNVIDIGANRLVAGSTITGSTGTSTTTLGLQIQAAAPLVPTITNVEGLQLDLGSNGTLISATPNTSITGLTILDVTAGANANAYNLVGFNAINSVTWGTTGGVNNQGGALTLSGTGALAYGFANQAAAAFTTGNSLVLGAQNLTGYTALTINTLGGLASNGAFTVTDGGAGVDINGNGTLQSLSVTNAATGITTLGLIDSTTAANRGSLTLVDVSNVAGQAVFQIGQDSLAAGSVINGAVGATTITFDGASQAGATSLTVNLQNANNNYNGSTITTNTLNQVVTAGSGNNTIATGGGTDVITVGVGSNTVSAGAGINTVTFGSNAATGATDIFVLTNTTLTAGNQTTLANWTVASPDRINVSDAGTNAVLINGDGSDVTVGAASVVAYAGAAVTLAAGNNFVNATGLGATTAAALQVLLQAAGTAIDLNGASVAAAGEMLLMEYLHTDGSVHLAAINFVNGGADTSAAAATVTDVVLTGQATALTATELFYVA